MGSTRPYYRRHRPAPQNEGDFLRDVGLRWIIGRLKVGRQLPAVAGTSLRALMLLFPPAPPESVRALVANMLIRGGVCPHVDLENAHIDAYSVADPVAAARALADKRAAAAVFASVSPHLGVRMMPTIEWKRVVLKPVLDSVLPFPVDDATGKTVDTPGDNLHSLRALLEMKFYGDAAPTVWHPTTKSLAAMAYADYFPGERGDQLRAMVSQALMSASSGWCGTYGPGVGSTDLLGKWPEGNYDMPQQHLLRTAYAYFEELSPGAREHLVKILLAGGTIHRIDLDDTPTSGRSLPMTGAGPDT